MFFAKLPHLNNQFTIGFKTLGQLAFPLLSNSVIKSRIYTNTPAATDLLYFVCFVLIAKLSIHF